MFHIIDDWYLVAEENCWMVGRMVGQVKSGRNGTYSPKFLNQVYMASPEDALKAWATRYVRSQALRQQVTGELSDALTFLSSENKRLYDSIEEAFRWAKGKEVGNE